MLVLAREIHYLRHFRLCDLVCENATFSHAMLMDVQHDLSRLFARLVEEALDDMHYELHRGVVVVQQQHTIEAGPFGLRLDARGNPGCRTTLVAAAGTIV